jgi:hypothetical protein
MNRFNRPYDTKIYRLAEEKPSCAKSGGLEETFHGRQPQKGPIGSSYLGNFLMCIHRPTLL